jgi:hypothetical protein
MNEQSYERWEELWKRIRSGGHESLNEWEKDWINLRSLIDSINNGGMISYFYNPSGDQLAECLVALDRLNAYDLKSQVLKICELFPTGVPDSISERNDVIRSWDDDVDDMLAEIDDSTAPLLEDLETKLDALVAANCSDLVT